MAITRDQVKAAIAQYLPKNLNYSQDSLGSTDSDALFSRMVQMIAVAFALDENALFYVVHLSLQRLLTSVDGVISGLETLSGDDQLLAADADPPVQITDITALKRARNALMSMEYETSRGEAFPSSQAESMDALVQEFLDDGLSQNLAANTASIDAALTASMAKLATAWEDMLTMREQVFAIVDAFEDVDVKGLAAQAVLSSASTGMSDAVTTLEASDATEQGADAENLLVTLAAIRAVVKLIGDAPEVFGTASVTPSESQGVGKLPRTDLSLKGHGDVVPADYVARSSTGRPFINYVVGGSRGYTESADAPSGILTATEAGTYDFSGELTLSFTYSHSNSDGTVADKTTTYITVDFTPAWSMSMAGTASGLNAILADPTGSYSGAPTISAYGEGLSNIAFGTDGLYLTVYNTNEDGFTSYIQIDSDTSDSVITEFGLEHGDYDRGSSLTHYFRDGLMTGKHPDTSAPDPDFHFGTYMGLGTAGTGVLSDTHDDLYYLCLKTTGLNYKILEVLEDLEGSYLRTEGGLASNAGGASITALAAGATHWAVAKGRPLGSFFYSEGAMRQPSSAGYPDGRTLSTGTHWEDPSVADTGALETTVTRIPQTGGSAGDDFRGLGRFMVLVPRVKCEGLAKNAYQTGTGDAAPNIAAGTTGFARKPIAWGSNARHGYNTFYTGTHGEIIPGSARSGFFAGTSSLDSKDVTIGDYLIVTGQSSSPTDALTTAQQTALFDRSFRVLPYSDSADFDEDATYGKIYGLLQPEWYAAYSGSVGNANEWGDSTWFNSGGVYSNTYDKLDFLWVDAGYFRAGVSKGFSTGDTYALPGDYLIINSPVAGTDHGSVAAGKARVYEVASAVSDKVLTLNVTTPYGGDDLGNNAYGYTYDNYYRTAGAASDHLWGDDGSEESTLEPGEDITGSQHPLKWFLMRRGTIDVDIDLPDWWSTGTTPTVTVSNESVFAFGTPDVGADFFASGVLAGQKLSITSADDTYSSSTHGTPHIVDDWYIYMLQDAHTLYACKNDGSDGAADFKYFSDNCDWKIVREDVTSLFEDTSATFISNGVQAGMTLRITAGTYAADYTIDTVESETMLKVEGTPFTSGKIASAYAIPLAATKVYSPDAFFQSGGVEAGDIVRLYDHDSTALIESTLGLEEFTVSAVDDNFILTLNQTIRTSDFYFTNCSVHVRAKKDDDSESPTYDTEVTNIAIQLDIENEAKINFEDWGGSLNKFREIGATMEDTDGDTYVPTLRLQKYGASSGDFTDVGIVGRKSTEAVTRVQATFGSGVTSGPFSVSDREAQTLVIDEYLTFDDLLGWTNTLSTEGQLYWEPQTNGSGNGTGFYLIIRGFNVFGGGAGTYLTYAKDQYYLWSIFHRFVTTAFIDESNNLSTLCDEEDLLIVAPGGSDRETTRIETVDSVNLLTLHSGIAVDVETDLEEIRDDMDEGRPLTSGSEYNSGDPTIASDLFGTSGLTYAVLPAGWPAGGMEFVSGNYRYPIRDIVQSSSKHVDSQVVIELETAVPSSLGQGVTFFVVRAGADPFSSFFTDEDPIDVDGVPVEKGFKNSDIDLIGATLQYTGRFSETVKIIEVVDSETVRVDKPLKLEPRRVEYRILTDDVGSTDTLTKTTLPAALSDAVGGEVLTIWTEPEVLTVSTEYDAESLSIKFYPKVVSDRDELYFTTVTGGAKDYGRYLLLDYLNGQLSLDEDLSTLNLHVAEVIHKQGEQLTEFFDVSTNSVRLGQGTGDGGDEYTPFLDLALLVEENPGSWTSSDIVTNFGTMRVGDRLVFTYRAIPDTVDDSPEDEFLTVTTYITSVPDTDADNPYAVSVHPEIPVTIASTSDAELYTTPDTLDTSRGPWSYRIVGVIHDRTVISFALNEADEIKTQAQALRDLIVNYTVGTSDAVDKIVALLEENGMDRAVDLLLDGKIDDFFGMSASDASFAAAAKAAVQAAGRILL